MEVSKNDWEDGFNACVQIICRLPYFPQSEKIREIILRNIEKFAGDDLDALSSEAFKLFNK